MKEITNYSVNELCVFKAILFSTTEIKISFIEGTTSWKDNISA